MKNNGDIIPFLKQKDYIMINNNLGGGSFAKTVLLKDPFIDELFVAKKYEPEFPEIKEKFYENFLEEIKILHKLNHKNVVRVYNYYAYENIFTGYILMEYVDGTDIGTFIHDYFEPFESTKLDEIFMQLVDAFCYIESHGVIHRDIREKNILVDKNGTIKVIDFGIGKVFGKSESSCDSLASQINRATSDTLPQEYQEGKYTSLTDMFYLAELFNRLMDNMEYKKEANFSYHRIVDKMMAKKPEDRYPSFAAVKDDIEKHDFANMNISPKDKKIYQAFATVLYQTISEFIDDRKFNSDPSVFIARLEKALKNNLFEDNIQKNADIIGGIVSGGYRYDNTVKIPCDVVRDFLQWFKESTLESQNLIMSNLISKISIIRVNETMPDLPF